jgi:hypothetical protein
MVFVVSHCYRQARDLCELIRKRHQGSSEKLKFHKHYLIELRRK